MSSFWNDLWDPLSWIVEASVSFIPSMPVTLLGSNHRMQFCSSESGLVGDSESIDWNGSNYPLPAPPSIFPQPLSVILSNESPRSSWQVTVMFLDPTHCDFSLWVWSLVGCYPGHYYQVSSASARFLTPHNLQGQAAGQVRRREERETCLLTPLVLGRLLFIDVFFLHPLSSPLSLLPHLLCYITLFY